MAGLRTRTRPHEHDALCRGECRFGGGRDVHQARHQNQAVALQVSAGPHDIHIEAKAARRLVPAEDELVIAEVRPLRLDAGDPACLVVIDDGDAGLPRAGKRTELAQFLADGRRLAPALREFVQARQVEAGMHLFLREGGLPPAEVAHHLRAMGKRLPRPQPHHAALWHRVPRRPVHRARLLLHHPETALADTAIEIVMEGGDVGMRGPRPAVLLRLAEGEALDEADRIGIPRGEIEIVAHGKVIKVVEEAHEVVGDPAPWRMRPQDLALHGVIRCHLLRVEAPEIELGRRVRFGDRENGQGHLLEVGHLHRPEGIAPGLVQLLGRLIVAAEPVAEGLQVRLAPREDGVVAAVFVVGLPSHQAGMIAIALGDDLDDAAALLPIGLR